MWFRGLLVNTSFLEEYILTPEGDTVVYIGPSWTSLVYLFIWCVLYLLCVCVCVCVCAQSLQSYPNLCDCLDCSLPGYSSWGSPGKNTGVGCHTLL